MENEFQGRVAPPLLLWIPTVMQPVRLPLSRAQEDRCRVRCPPKPDPKGGSLPAQALDRSLGSVRELGATDGVRQLVLGKSA